MIVTRSRLELHVLLVCLFVVGGCVTPRQTAPDAGHDAGRAGSDGHVSTDLAQEGGTGGGSVDDAGPETAVDVPVDQAEQSDAPFDLANDNADVGGRPPDAATGLKDNGTTCGTRGECRSGNCTEGVCCDDACGAKCNSCLIANTGKPTGQCAAVKAGLPHGTDCAASDPTTCGLDGKCDGTGACSHHPLGTICVPEACSDGATVSTYVSPRRCDGAGACGAASPSNCGGTYRCGGTKCNPNCSGAQQCTTGAYCSATTCVPKKEEGALCLAPTECANGSCSGRCCLGCKCTQPSPANLLKNPGFDKDSSGWTVVANGTSIAGGASWSSADVERCPYSGALVVSISASLGSAEVDSCAKNLVLDGNFNFGVRAFVVGGGQAVCGVRFYASSDCSGNEIVDDELNPISGTDWQSPVPESSDPFVGVAGGHSVLFFCDLSGSSDYYFDQPYVSKMPFAY
ncbi:MAG: Flagellar hook-length control protein FliK [Myxococcales bacterium]|nr:Flagellar hook-length control protein FliK [Myxococcales bacterium]